MECAIYARSAYVPWRTLQRRTAVAQQPVGVLASAAWPGAVGVAEVDANAGGGGQILDVWALAPLDTSKRADLLEVIDDRAATRGTIISGQLLVEHWHSWIGDVTIANAILDRLLQRNPQRHW